MIKGNIKLKDKDGTWYAWEKIIFKDKKYYFVEREQPGANFPCFLIDAKTDEIIEEVDLSLLEKDATKKNKYIKHLMEIIK